ncbi:MAG TPA: metal-dependent transcriptional regulator [Candidatus Krumholzibacteriaceae bacterium]|nr:metal-dependent transcriptional regulator [Candidatus Krumholzibacteriaceae bacterium]
MVKEEHVLSAESEEYLEAIFRLQEKDGVAKTSHLARELGVVPGSITNTIEHLEKHGLVVHEPYRGVKLTEKGEKRALEIIRHHRLAERFLTDILHVSWSKAHKLACRLEHAFTKDVSKSLEDTLRNPKTCPHGNPIPSENGVLVKEHLESLSSLKPGAKATVMRIAEETPEILQHLEKAGLMPGTLVEVEKSESTKNLKVKVDGKHHVLDNKLSSVVKVVSLAEEKRRRDKGASEPVYLLKKEMDNAIALTGLDEGSKGCVAFLSGGCGMVRRLAEMGLTPGTEITVLKRCPFRGPIEVSVRGVCVALGYGVATKIFVRPL